jgi:hypothetical protein
MPKLQWARVPREVPKDLIGDFWGEDIVYTRPLLRVAAGSVYFRLRSSTPNFPINMNQLAHEIYDADGKRSKLYTVSYE